MTIRTAIVRGCVTMERPRSRSVSTVQPPSAPSGAAVFAAASVLAASVLVGEAAEVLVAPSGLAASMLVLLRFLFLGFVDQHFMDRAAEHAHFGARRLVDLERDFLALGRNAGHRADDSADRHHAIVPLELFAELLLTLALAPFR